MAFAIEFADCGAEIERRFDECPMRRAPFAMLFDTRGEFAVADTRGCHVGDGQAAGGGQPFGMRALAGARAAENEGEIGRSHRMIVTAGATIAASQNTSSTQSHMQFSPRGTLMIQGTTSDAGKSTLVAG